MEPCSGFTTKLFWFISFLEDMRVSEVISALFSPPNSILVLARMCDVCWAWPWIRLEHIREDALGCPWAHELGLGPAVLLMPEDARLWSSEGLRLGVVKLWGESSTLESLLLSGDCLVEVAWALRHDTSFVVLEHLAAVVGSVFLMWVCVCSDHLVQYLGVAWDLSCPWDHSHFWLLIKFVPFGSLWVMLG